MKEFTIVKDKNIITDRKHRYCDYTIRINNNLYTIRKKNNKNVLRKKRSMYYLTLKLEYRVKRSVFFIQRSLRELSQSNITVTAVCTIHTN